MNNKRRIIMVGITLVVLAIVYKLVTGGSDTERGLNKSDIDVPRPATPPSTEGGKVGPIGIGTVKQTEYVTRDEQKRIQRVFGFSELLHQTGDNWQLNKPYIKIYEEEADITLSADTGSIQVQTMGVTPVPRDAKLTGNVRFHVVRKVAGGEEVSDVYLDELVFVSDRSTFYTDGAVRLVSPQCQMQGRGLEVVYNSEMNRLLFFHLDQLEDMRFRMKTGNSFFKQKRPDTVPAPASAPAPAAKTDAAAAALAVSDYYDCLLSDKVTIQYGEEVVLVDKSLLVHNILWTPTGPSDKKAAAAAVDPASSASTATSAQAEPTVEVRVVCGGGVVIKPVSGTVEQFRVRGAQKAPAAFALTEDELAKRNVFSAKAMEYDAVTGDGRATGPVEAVFFADPLSATDVVMGKTRTSISSSKYATYSSKANEVRFVGDVIARAVEPAQGWTQKSTIYSDEAVAKIRSSSDGGAGGLSNIEDVNCMGKLVKLETVRKNGEKLLGGVNLKCLNLHYSGAGRVLTATGPGVIAVDNSHIENKAESSTQVNLSKRCYAAVDKFGRLQWFVDSGRIVADPGSEGLRIAYWPVLDGGGYGSRIVADTHGVAGSFVRLADGRTEIDTLNAFGGVYIERGENQKIWGDKFVYKQDAGLLTITGRPDKPCVYNGVKANQFEMNVTTGSVKTKLNGGGVNQ